MYLYLCQGLNLLMWRAHQSYRDLALSFLTCCQRLEREQTAVQGTSVGLFVLTWPCVCCVWMNVCCEPHQSTTLGLSCYDLWPRRAPRHREAGGGGVRNTVKHQGKGRIDCTASEFTTANKTSMDKDIVICLVNFYRDLWAATHKWITGTHT